MQEIKKYTNDILKELQKVSKIQWVTTGYIIFAIYFIVLIYRYIHALLWVENRVITNNPVLILIFSITPFFLWAASTEFDVYYFRNRKRALLYTVTANAVLTIEQPIIYISYKIMAMKALKISVTDHMTSGMVVNLARISILIPLILASFIIISPIKAFLTNVETRQKIDNFRIQYYVDMRKDKSHAYDLTILRDINTGAKKIIKEIDRFVHLFINGASGTGKTSSTIIPAIVCDLDKKCENMLLRQEEILKLVKEKKAYIAGPYKEVNEYNVRAKKGYEKELEAIRKKYPDCGITAMAPNNSMNDDIVSLCQARGIPVNIIDPMKVYDEKCAKRKRLSPFYLPPNLTDAEKIEYINNAASTFTEVLLSASNTTGKESDPYFKDINEAVTTNVVKIMMLAASLEKRQTNITEIQTAINNFKYMESALKTIETAYGIEVEVINVKEDKNNNQTSLNQLASNKNKENGHEHPFYMTFFFVKNELLGSGYEKMYDQSRGLRNLINKILSNPKVKDLLSGNENDSINFERILARSEVTVVNTALEMSAQTSTSLGIIFMLFFTIAVQKRPKNNRQNHFVYIDEASQYMHSMYDNMFALWRQYRVAAAIAMQSISQMEKRQDTAYLKDVILGAGTHIVFGRISDKEMKMYQELAGLTFTEEVQESFTQTSIAASNPNQTEAKRISITQKNNVEGSDIRIRGFQEVTVFTVNLGNVNPGYIAKLNFAKKKDFENKHIKRVNWGYFIPKEKRQAQLSKKAAENENKTKNLLKTSNTTITNRTNTKTPVDNVKDLSKDLPREIIKEEEFSDLIMGLFDGED